MHPPSTAGYLLLLNANVLIIKTPPAAHMIPHFYDSTVSFVNIRHLACAPSTPKLFNSDGFLALQKVVKDSETYHNIVSERYGAGWWWPNNKMNAYSW